MIKKILFAWLGNTDLRAAEANGAEGLGPVAEAVKERGYPCVRLLCNYGRKKSAGYTKWFHGRFPDVDFSVIHADLEIPTDFSGIYENAVRVLEKEGKAPGELEFTFHISPGTPAMAAI